VHFAANEFKEGHMCDVFRLHFHKTPPPAQRGMHVPTPINSCSTLGDAIRRGVKGR
jgi:hypothetical protein